MFRINYFSFLFLLLVALSVATWGCNPPPPDATDGVDALENVSDTLQSDSVILNREKVVQDQIKVEGNEKDTLPVRDTIR